jgi:hypothetical protein
MPAAGLAAASVLVGAVAMEVAVLDPGNPVTPAIVLGLLLAVVWLRREQTMALIARILSRS